MKQQLKSFKLGFKTIPVQFVQGFITPPHNPTEKFRLKDKFGIEELVELERKDRVEFYFYNSDYEDLITLRTGSVDFKSGENVSIIELGDTFWFFGKRTAFYKAAVVGHSSNGHYFIPDSRELSKRFFHLEFVDNILLLVFLGIAIGFGYWASINFGSIFWGVVAGFIALPIASFIGLELIKILNKLIWNPLGDS